MKIFAVLVEESRTELEWWTLDNLQKGRKRTGISIKENMHAMRCRPGSEVVHMVIVPRWWERNLLVLERGLSQNLRWNRSILYLLIHLPFIIIIPLPPFLWRPQNAAMKISQKIEQSANDGKVWWSFEYFPPRTAQVIPFIIHLCDRDHAHEVSRASKIY